ncbi:shikimate dehydrogenase [Thalassotalea maritima]|uniref:shikimate dehydrogenase n=1 Tax=Thalassotalea maritima TaxID=3242416 RepID=UPI00352706DC
MDKFLVVGNPIGQSKSPIIHKLFATQTNIELSYEKYLTTSDDFDDDMRNFFTQGGKGANVTAPFKEQAFALCDCLSSDANAAGAVNTLYIQNGKIVGDNTDGRGLVADLLNHKVTLADKTILLLGAGGASRGVILPLLAQQPKHLIVVNRTQSKADALIAHFNDSRLSTISYQQTAEVDVDIIINATSASLSAELPPLAPTAVVNATCYDMVYNHQLTPFLAWCQNHKASQVIDGLGMLVGQAAESFAIWHGVKPAVAPVLNSLREQL